MAESTIVNPSTAVATALVDALVAAGVTEIVLCPGSRSSAMAYAVASAERAGHLRVHVRVDERSAGFLALGLAKVSRRPAVVITTSGTAVANLHPAVLEAHHAHVPLVVLSTDRPVDVRGTGANQTTTQPGMFGAGLRFEADLADGDVEGAAVAATEAVLAAGAAIGGGPAHLNVQFREPLVPDLDDAAASLASTLTRGEATEATTVSDVAGAVALPERTLVVLGDLPDLAQSRAVLAWAEQAGLPVLAEPFGSHPRQGRQGVVAHGVLVVGVEHVLTDHEPEAVLLVGRPTLSRPVSRLLQRPGPRLVIVDAGLELAVPGRDAERLDLVDLLASTVDGDPGAWRRSWLDLGARVAAAIDADPPAWPTGPALARAVIEALPGDDPLVFLGSSNTPRDVDVAAAIDRPVDVLASRGLAGIDGCVSTAIGLALAAPDRATYAMMGDLTFLHDSGGLLIGPDEPRPDLTIVVANDDGGGIFTTLEPGAPERAADFERLFGTPTGTELSALCRAHGIRHEKTSTPTELADVLARRPAGLTVVEVTIDRSTHRGERARLRALAERALG
jgi:2-succinyl-5-enolpyruvyl-6-hydroxy-3-cyclohexene-1-carboxylate synthase